MAQVNQHHKKTRLIAVAALVVGVLGLGIAFAALNANLLIKGTATIESASWSVQWKTTTPGTPACTATGEASVSTPSITQTATLNDTITISPSFKTDGDTVTCTFTAINSGSIAAKLGTIAPTTDELTDNDISVTLTYGDGATPTAGNPLAAGGGTQAYKLVFVYEGGPQAVEVDDLDYDFIVPYEQANQ
jgi:hypothetical protein